MPFVVLVWLLLPWILDLWLTVVVAEATGLNIWYFFLASAVLGLVLLAWEWRRVQTCLRALRRLEGSPWSLLASARRGLAALLLILPGLGSDVLALLLLSVGWRGAKRAKKSSSTNGTGSANGNGASEAARAAYRVSPERASPSPSIIEGEFRREE